MEDINENVSGYGPGNHSEAYIVIIQATAIIQICLTRPNALTNLTEILNLHLWCDDPLNEKIKLNFEEQDKAPLRLKKEQTLKQTCARQTQIEIQNTKGS